jgi:hypothetical protein
MPFFSGDMVVVVILFGEDADKCGWQIMMLKRMREMTNDHNPTIQKLALAALMAVYKDVIPGYRIRPLTEEEQKVKVSKDIKKLRTFEQGLVSGYQTYVEKLGKLVKCETTLLPTLSLPTLANISRSITDGRIPFVDISWKGRRQLCMPIIVTCSAFQLPRRTGENFGASTEREDD